MAIYNHTKQVNNVFIFWYFCINQESPELYDSFIKYIILVEFMYKFSMHPVKFLLINRPSFKLGTPPIYIYLKTNTYLINIYIAIVRIFLFHTSWLRSSLSNSPLTRPTIETRSTEKITSSLFLIIITSCQMLSSNKLPTDKLVMIFDPKEKKIYKINCNIN